MATLNQTVASKDAYATLRKAILEGLQAPLEDIVDGAIREAVGAVDKTDTSDTEPNEVTRPTAGGMCAKVWDMLDKTASEKGAIPTLQEVQKLAKRRRLNSNTARVQYYRWRSAQPAAPTPPVQATES
jgi:hypothetical protein